MRIVSASKSGLKGNIGCAVLLGIPVFIAAGILLYVFVMAEIEHRQRMTMDKMKFTLCFRPFAQSFSRKDEFYRDEEKHCYGQRIAMPRAYFDQLHVSDASLLVDLRQVEDLDYTPITEELTIRVGWPSLTPGAFISQEELDKRNYRDIRIEPLDFGRFDELVRQKYGFMKRFNYSKRRTVHGLNLYRGVYNDGTETGNLLLFPPHDAQLFVRCNAPYRDTTGVWHTNTGCRVTSNVDDRVTIRYWVSFEALEQLDHFDIEFTELVRGFLVY